MRTVYWAALQMTFGVASQMYHSGSAAEGDQRWPLGALAS
jgi:hypothetical protein